MQWVFSPRTSWEGLSEARCVLRPPSRSNRGRVAGPLVPLRALESQARLRRLVPAAPVCRGTLAVAPRHDAARVACMSVIIAEPAPASGSDNPLRSVQ